MSVRPTGERAFTSEAGFNPAWQRHVFAYVAANRLLPPGRLLDLGCGIGHSFELLSPRETVGVDIDKASLAGQARETVVADMRELPFPDGSFASVLSSHSVEHVPDPDRVVSEVRRVLGPGGWAMFVTPNRLTFGRPNEIIDPYHYVEFDHRDLRQLCSGAFEEIEIHGVFGSPRYLEFTAGERRKLDALLRKDPLRLRRLIPRRVRKRLYDHRLARERRDPDPIAEAITTEDFELRSAPLDEALDLVALCRRNPA